MVLRPRGRGRVGRRRHPFEAPPGSFQAGLRHCIPQYEVPASLRHTPRLLPILAGIIDGSAGAAAIRSARVRARTERLAAALLETLLRAIDGNDAETGRHVRRVARSALILAEVVGLRAIERIALFHDIGKIHEALFDLIHDPSALSPEERDETATHPERGADVLAPLVPFYPTLGDGVLSHHERWDGSGYPRALAGRAIPLEARIVAIADAFDAITQGRRYSEPRTLEKGRKLMASARGTQLDPRWIDLFLSDAVFARIPASLEVKPARRRIMGASMGASSRRGISLANRERRRVVGRAGHHPRFFFAARLTC